MLVEVAFVVVQRFKERVSSVYSISSSAAGLSFFVPEGFF